jgi:mannose-1-phosphate guanylyltransferase
MKALILVGGFGTRLRPLTLALPKPLVPFINKPMIIHQVEALKAAGVTEVILAVAYRPDAMKDEMERWGKELGVKFVFSHEQEPLGTAGPLALARDLLMTDDEPFFVLNSDVTCKFPLVELLQFHKKHGKEGTIMVTKVEQWEKYGVVVYDEKDGKIQQFAEKPKKFVGDKINSGIYILNKAVLNRIKLEKTSIETQVFPAMAKDGELYAMELEGFWMDIGQPKDYIAGLDLFLPHLAARNDKSLLTREEAAKRHVVVHGSVVVHPTAQIAEGAELGPNVTIGANCKIGPCARLSNCAIFDNTTIGKGAYVSKSIVGWNNTVGSWAHLENITVTGDDVQISANLFINGAKVLPNKSVKESVKEPEVIM